MSLYFKISFHSSLYPWHRGAHFLHMMIIIRAVETVGGGGALAPFHILADQLALFQPEGDIIPTTLQLSPPRIFNPSYGPDHQSSSRKTEQQQQFQYCSSPFQNYSSFLPTYSILPWFIIIMVPNPVKLTVQ